MKKIQVFLFFFLGVGVWVQAQNLDPSVIAPAGGIDSNQQISLEWTLGELAIATNATSKMMLTEGYHQPVLEVSDFFEKEMKYSNRSSDFQISVFPNPLQSQLNVKIQSEKDEVLFLRLFNLQGEQSIEYLKKNSNDEFEMNLSSLPTGMYFLRFSNVDGEVVKTFKLSKIN